MATLLDKLKPTDFQTERHYFGTFGEMHTEVAARWIIRFLQHRMTLGEVSQNGWAPFMFGELNMFYNLQRAATQDWFQFKHLIEYEGETSVRVSPDRHGPFQPEDVVTVTDHFVRKLLSASGTLA